jgi:hypothetical protein
LLVSASRGTPFGATGSADVMASAVQVRVRLEQCRPRRCNPAAFAVRPCLFRLARYAPSGATGSAEGLLGRRCTLLSFERPLFFVVLLGRRARARAHLENSIATSTRVLSDQENKGTRWMPWRQELMKDVGGCDKPRGGADQPSIRGFPNGETHAW